MKLLTLQIIFVLSCSQALALDLIYDTATGKASLAPKAPTLMDPFEPKGYSTREIPARECESLIENLPGNKHSLTQALEGAPDGLLTQAMTELERPNENSLEVLADYLQGKGHGVGELISISKKYNEAFQIRPRSHKVRKLSNEAMALLEEIGPSLFPPEVSIPVRYRVRDGIPYEVIIPYEFLHFFATPSEQTGLALFHLGEIPTLRSLVIEDFKFEDPYRMGSARAALSTLGNPLRQIRSVRIVGTGDDFPAIRGIPDIERAQFLLQTILGSFPRLYALGLVNLQSRFIPFLFDLLSDIQPQLVSLDLSHNHLRHDAVAMATVEPVGMVAKFKHLNLSNNPEIGFNAVNNLSYDLPHLQSLDLSGTGLQAEARLDTPHLRFYSGDLRVFLQPEFSRLKLLRIENMPHVTQEHIDSLRLVRPNLEVIGSPRPPAPSRLKRITNRIWNTFQ